MQSDATVCAIVCGSESADGERTTAHMDSSGCDSLRLLAGDGNHVRTIGALRGGWLRWLRVANQFCDSARLAGHQRHLRATPGSLTYPWKSLLFPLAWNWYLRRMALITVYERHVPDFMLIGDRYARADGSGLAFRHRGVATDSAWCGSELVAQNKEQNTGNDARADPSKTMSEKLMEQYRCANNANAVTLVSPPS